MQFNAQQQAAQLDLSYLLAESSANTFCKATIITYFTGASCMCVVDKPRQCKQTRLMVEMRAAYSV